MKYLEDRPLRITGEAYGLHCWRMLRWVSELRLLPAARETARNPLRRPLLYGPAAALTRPGKILLFASVIVLLLGYRHNQGFALNTSALLFGLLGWSALVGWWYRPRVEVERRGENWAVAGQTYSARVLLKNSRSRPLRNFVVREMAVRGCRLPAESARGYIDTLPGKSETEQVVEIVPRQRGALRLDGVVVDAYYPFFLTRTSQRYELDQELNVLPASIKVELPSLRLLSDQAAKSVNFGSDKGRRERALDYVYSRAYQTGDMPSRLDRRASARRGEPMSKIYHGALKLNPEGLVLIVDLSLASLPLWKPRPDDPAVLDNRLALAVEIERRARGEGLALEGCWWNNDWRAVSENDNFYRQVAEVTAVHQRHLPDQLDRKDSIHVLVTGRWDDLLEAWVDQWRAQGLMLLVVLLPEADDQSGQLPTAAGYLEVRP